MAYDRIEPIGDERIEYMLAQIAMMCVAPHTKKRQKLRDYIPEWGAFEKNEADDIGLGDNTRRAMAMFGHPDGKYK
jgi:hypothetical protein